MRATASMIPASAERTDCSRSKTEVGAALFSTIDWLRAGCVARRGATGIATEV